MKVRRLARTPSTVSERIRLLDVARGIVLILVAVAAAIIVASPSSTQAGRDVSRPTPPDRHGIVIRSQVSFTTSWSGARDNIAVKRYRIYQFKFGGWKRVGTTVRRRFKLVGLLPGRTYSFRLRALDSAGNISRPSRSWTTRTRKKIAQPVWTVLPATPSLVGPTDDICSGTQVALDEDIQTVLDSASEGTVICLDSGIHRIVSALVPRQEQRIVGQRGAVLSGAISRSDFIHENGAWYINYSGVQTPPVGVCVTGIACRYNEDVYENDIRLRRSMSKADLTVGSFWHDSVGERVWVGGDPTGQRIEIAVATRAFTGSASNVVVKNLVVEKFANHAQTGAFHFQGSGWVIEQNDVRLNHGAGICATSGARVRANYVQKNGQLGLCGTQSVNLLVEGNEVFENNTAGFSGYWEAGGSKFVRTQGLIVRNNLFHDNQGPGIWLDIDNRDSLVEFNTSSRNRLAGIFIEISYRSLIRNNAVIDNGSGQTCPVNGWCGFGIRIAESSGVEAYGNTVSGLYGSILLVQEQRDPGPLGVHEIGDISIHDNSITPGISMSGAFQNVDDNTYFSNRNIRFEQNHYYLDCHASEHFAWGNRRINFQEWNASGMDRLGTATCNL